MGALKVLSLKIGNYVVFVFSGESGLGNKGLIEFTDLIRQIRNVMQHAMVLAIHKQNIKEKKLCLHNQIC